MTINASTNEKNKCFLELVDLFNTHMKKIMAYQIYMSPSMNDYIAQMELQFKSIMKCYDKTKYITFWWSILTKIEKKLRDMNNFLKYGDNIDNLTMDQRIEEFNIIKILSLEDTSKLNLYDNNSSFSFKKNIKKFVSYDTENMTLTFTY